VKVCNQELCKTFDMAELKNGIEQMRYLISMSVPIVEKPITRDIDRVHRYN